MISRRFQILLLIPLLLTGCGKVEKSDVSNEEAYKDIIGLEIANREVLLLHAVVDEPFSKEPVKEYILTGEPGFSGRYVAKQIPIPKHICFKILRVVEEDMVFFTRISYVVKPISAKHFQNVFDEARIRLEDSIESPMMGLDSSLYQVGECPIT